MMLHASSCPAAGALGPSVHAALIELPEATAPMTRGEPSHRAIEAASLFGLDAEHSSGQVIAPACTFELPVPGIVFITGPSGGGKSTMLRLIGAQCRERGMRVIEIDSGMHETDRACPDQAAELARPIVDRLGGALHEAFGLLSMVGLSDAFVLLRSEAELSDGQRARFRLALALAQCDGGNTGTRGGSTVLLADEFAAALDRISARAIACNVRRWVDRSGCTFICATTHDDLLESLNPDLLIWKGLGSALEMRERAAVRNVVASSMPSATSNGTRR